MKTQRQLLIDAFKKLRKLGYVVVWKRATGCREFDVPEGKAGFDIRYWEETRHNKADFSEDGRLLDQIFVGWQTSTEDEKDTNAWNKMFRDMEQALAGTGIEVLMCGPSSDFSMILRPKFVRLS